MSSTKQTTESILLLEQPFARVPHENYRKLFRTSQKHIERELGAVQTMVADLMAKGEPLDDKALDAMITRITSLKRKLHELNETSGKQTTQVMEERFKHLAAIETFGSDADPAVLAWCDTRLDRWLVDWSLRHGKEKTASSIVKAKSIETLVDIDLFSHIRRIEIALISHSCTEALAWCNENKASLRKAKSTLEFELRLQEYIELARARRVEEARAYARKHLISWHETHIAEIRQAAALVAFAPSTTCGPYKRLYDPLRWDALVKSFRLAIYSLNGLPSEPLLHLAVYGGLASLKLDACFDPVTKNVDCPICDPALGTLAHEVPRSHHLNSTIVCALSGKIMDADNPPLALPNGYVYSQEALQEMAARNDGTVTCPRTGAKFEFTSLRKVFVS